MRCALLLLLALSLVGCAGCGRTTGAGITDSVRADSLRLDPRCETWFGVGVAAMICDPARAAKTRFKIHGFGATTTGEPRVAVAQLPGNEPALPGAEVEFDLTGGSRQTVAALRVTDGSEPRRVVIAPFDPPAKRYVAEIRHDSVRVTTDRGEVRTIKLTRPAPAPLSSRTPEQLVRSFATAMSGDREELGRTCGLLADGVRTVYSSGEFTCAGVLQLVIHNDEYAEYPDYERSVVHSVSLGRQAGLSVARVRVRHDYSPTRPDEPSHKTVTAIVPIAREAGGWRIVLPDPLLPYSALNGEFQLGHAELRRRLERLDAAAGAGRRTQRERDAATRSVTSDPSCAGAKAEASDPRGDITLAQGGDKARTQDAAGIDVISATHARDGAAICFLLRFRTALAVRLTLQLAGYQGDDISDPSGQVEVEINRGRGVGVAKDQAGERVYFPARVAIDSERRLLAVSLDGSKAWPRLDLDKPYRWGVALFELAPAIGGAYVEHVPENELRNRRDYLPSP